MDRVVLDRIKIEGYKSIKSCDLGLRNLNVLIGPNGAGKSNFIDVFNLLAAIRDEKLQVAIGEQGGASSLLHFGRKQTDQILIEPHFRHEPTRSHS
jgi:predicted ATPase